MTGAGCRTTSAPSADELQEALQRLATLDGAGLDEAELLDHLSALEKLNAGLAAAQARVTVTLVRARTKREAEQVAQSSRIDPAESAGATTPPTRRGLSGQEG